MNRWILYGGGLKFPLERMSGNEIVLEKESFSFTYSPDGLYRIFMGQRYCDVLLEKTGSSSYRAYMDHHCFNVILEDTLDETITASRASHLLTQSEASVRAPMPGLVTSVEVKTGDLVTVGARLVILEAMKMENQIRSDVTAIVKSVRVKPGETVEKGQVLLFLEADK